MSDSKKVKVLCVGSTSQDIFFPTDEYTVLETPEDILSKSKALFEVGGKFRVADRFEAVGGVAANISVGLGRQGVGVACYSSIGDDQMGDWCIAELEKNNVDTSFITRQKNTKTDLSAIVVLMKSGERIIFHNRDANELLSVDESKLADTEWIFISALNGAWRENLKHILRVVQEKPIKLAINPGQHNLREDPALILEVIRHTSFLALNKDEAIELLLASDLLTETEKQEKIDDEETLLFALHRAGAKIITLTDGARGGWISDGHSLCHAPILPNIQSVDMTGAGDAFASASFGALISGLPLETALRYGIGNGGSVVKHYGAIDGLLSQSELEILTKNLRIEKIR
ncbi:MAG: PfkB protein [Patescibacteria group bacterium]|nr:PfkB protein [Patescibacteria group bacterium]